MKGKEGVSEKMLNEKQASQLSDIEFKELVIKKLNKLTQHYQTLQGNYNELTTNYINMKKEIETINKVQREMKNTITELNNTIQNQKQPRWSRGLNQQAGGWGRKKFQKDQEKEKRLKKDEAVLRELQDNMKRNNIRIIGIPEGEEEEQGIETCLKK